MMKARKMMAGLQVLVMVIAMIAIVLFAFCDDTVVHIIALAMAAYDVKIAIDVMHLMETIVKEASK